MSIVEHIFPPFRDIIRGMQDIFYPPVCLHCNTLIEQPTVLNGLCSSCLGTLQPLPTNVIHQNVMQRLHPCYVDEAWAAFRFTEVIRSLIHAIKYQHMPNLGVSTGRFIADRVEKEVVRGASPLVIPIPLHSTRQKEREYNQSLELAKGIFSGQPGAIHSNLLIRRRYTRSQTRLNREERQANVQDAFEARDSEVLRGKPVFLVDDVITTGSTMNECARVLKEHGAARVVGIALATPGKDDVVGGK